MDERICMLRLRAKIFNISLICVYAPNEEAQEEDAFHQKLEEKYDSIRRYDVRIVFGDLNVKIGKEELLNKTMGKESLHKSINDNGITFINYAISKNVMVRSTRLQRKSIKKMTCLSLNGVTENQIDHVAIDTRHARNITQVESSRGADRHTDYYLVRIKYRERIAVHKNNKGKRGDILKRKN